MSTHDDSDFAETTLETRRVFDGVLLHVRADTVRLPNGKTSQREYIEHPGAAAILAFIDERTVLMERQFRYPLRRDFVELPAGKIDAGETPLATAQRELKEECGFEAASWRHLATLHPCIGYADEHIELYLARELTHVGHALDEDEFLQVIEVDVAQALEWVRTGRITEPKAILGLLWADKLVAGEWA